MLSQDLIEEDRPPVTYPASFSMATIKYACTVPNCARTAGTKYGLRRHFLFLHPQDLVNMPGEGFYPQWGSWGMPVNSSARGHQGPKSCMTMHVTKMQQKAVSNSAATLDAKSHAYRGELERVGIFKYLGRLVKFYNDDTHSVRGNLAKARRAWATIPRILQVEHVPARACDMFYKAIVQAVLPLNSENWVLAPATLRQLEGCHVRGARHMTGMLPKKIGGNP